MSLLKVSEAAKILRCSETKIRELYRQNKIKAVWLGKGKVFIPEQEIIAFIERGGAR
ncbi:helix-turn-helix domain-containing protein [Caloramator sp. CAR-1]|uniref:helix-turn-helix domain-containing protein n=1 Tax=Caloramator sp. CAR-1 TaxID=3062777 RepID=UPI0026E1CA2E|nr:helix-turn-helix domain-containing protein [Caloramator sp. CAR-1]